MGNTSNYVDFVWKYGNDKKDFYLFDKTTGKATGDFCRLDVYALDRYASRDDQTRLTEIDPDRLTDKGRRAIDTFVRYGDLVAVYNQHTLQYSFSPVQNTTDLAARNRFLRSCIQAEADNRQWKASERRFVNPVDFLKYLTRVRREQMSAVKEVFAACKKLNCETMPLDVFYRMLVSEKSRDLFEKLRTGIFRKPDDPALRTLLRENADVVQLLFRTAASNDPWRSRTHKSTKFDETFSLKSLRESAYRYDTNRLLKKGDGQYFSPVAYFLPGITRNIRENGVQALKTVLADSRNISVKSDRDVDFAAIAASAPQTYAGSKLLADMQKAYYPQISCDDPFMHKMLLDGFAAGAFQPYEGSASLDIFHDGASFFDMERTIDGIVKNDAERIDVAAYDIKGVCDRILSDKRNVPFFDAVFLHVREDGQPVYYDEWKKDMDEHPGWWVKPHLAKRLEQMNFPDGFSHGFWGADKCSRTTFDWRMEIQDCIGSLSKDGEASDKPRNVSAATNYYSTIYVSFPGEETKTPISYQYLKDEFMARWHPELQDGTKPEM